MSQFETEVNPEIIFTASIDFDGCAHDDDSRESIIKHITHTCQSIRNLKKIILMIGSLRQSVYLDVLNAKMNSTYPNYISCASIIEHIEPRLKEIFPDIEISADTYLLFDSFQQLQHGTTFKGMQKLFAEINPQYIRDLDLHSNTVLESACYHEESGTNLLTANHFADCSKISIIYAQFHHIATQHPDKQVVMHFYDDKIGILSNLYNFYKKNLQWIPENISLHLFKQIAIKGHNPVKATPTLLGDGPVNNDYHRQLLNLAESFKWQSIPEGFNGFGRAFQNVFLTPSLTESFTAIIDEVEPSPYESIQIPSRFDSAITKQEFYQWAREEAETIYNKHLTTEKEFFTEFVNSLDNYENFKDEYDCWYEIVKLKKFAYGQNTLEKILELESILLINLGRDFEMIKEEAQYYANAHLTYDQRVLDCTAFYHQSLQDLINKIDRIPVQQLRILTPTTIRPRVPLSLFNPSDIENNDSLPMSPR